MLSVMHREAPTMRARAVVLAAAIVMAPLGAMAADFVVWWEEGFYPQATEAVAEIGAAFEQKIGKDVEIVFQTPEEMLGLIRRDLSW
jgi:ABC-type glycerol-3-phosphate transport system substrate-binding protein